MARRCNKRDGSGRLVAFAMLIALLVNSPVKAAACPFCNAVRPSFAQQREAADAVALAEVVGPSDNDAADSKLSVRIRSVLTGSDLLHQDQLLALDRGEALRPGTLCLIWGTRTRSPDGAQDADQAPSAPATAEWVWNYRPVNEGSYAYFARAPELRVAAAERLRYFARFLEHPDATIADDAYLEFGHAPFDVVAQVADVLPLDNMRGWLLDEQVPQERHGFYGLALGLAREPAQRKLNAEFLSRLIGESTDDFRAGFDGILGGYLLASGAEGLQLIDQRFLANPNSPDGEVRSALSALRFYREYGKEISIERLQASLRQLLERREFAAEVIVDLARWQDWSVVDQVAALYDAPADLQPTLRRAVVGYLAASPAPPAAEALAQLRSRDPRGVSDAEVYLKAFGSLR